MTSKKIQTLLKSIHIKPLTTEEKIRVWDQIRFGMALSTEATPQKFKQKTLSPFKKWAYAGIIFGLTTTTVFAADNSRPGDFLFPMNLALENIQLSLTPASQQNSVKMHFALKRVEDVKEILKEVDTQQRTETSIRKATLVLSDEKNTAKNTFISKAPTEEINGQATGTALSSGATKINNAVQISVGTSTATTTVGQTISDKDKKRIEAALGTALSFLGDTKEEMIKQGDKDSVSYIDFMFKQLNGQIETLPNDVTFNVDLSQSKKTVGFEVVSKDNKTTIEATISKDQNATTTEEIKKTETASTKKIEIKDNSLSIIGKDVSEKSATTSQSAAATSTKTKIW